MGTIWIIFSSAAIGWGFHIGGFFKINIRLQIGVFFGIVKNRLK